MELFSLCLAWLLVLLELSLPLYCLEIVVLVNEVNLKNKNKGKDGFSIPSDGAYLTSFSASMCASLASVRRT